MPPTTTTLLDRLEMYLAENDLARLPADQGPGARPWPPPFWRNPIEGTPAPGERGRNSAGAITGNEADDGLVVGAVRASDIGTGPGEGSTRRRVVDLYLRSKTTKAIEDYAAAIAELLAPAAGGLEGAGIPGARYDWTMAGQHIVASQEWSPLGPVDATPGQGFTYRVSYLFEIDR